MKKNSSLEDILKQYTNETRHFQSRTILDYGTHDEREGWVNDSELTDRAKMARHFLTLAGIEYET